MKTYIFILGAAALLAPLTARGETAHAYQMGSRDSKWGFAEFPTDNIDAISILKPTSASDDQIGAGEYVDGRYYTYTLMFDFLFGDGLEPSEYVVWDAQTYEPVFRTESPNAGRVADMAYDYTHNTMYALQEVSRTSNGAIGETWLAIVDLATGALTMVGAPGDIKAVNGYGNTVDEHLIALASDPADGTLYAMGEYRQLYKLDRMTGLATPIGDRNRVAITNDFQSMAFDAAGNLYQVQMHPDYEYFMQIDPRTGALANPVTGQAVTVNQDFTNNAARFPEDPQLTGLWFEGKTYRTGLPAPVQGLAAVATPAEGPNTVKISWQLPSANQDGTPGAFTAVYVYRLGEAEPIARLGAEAVSYTDSAAPNGDVSYYVAVMSEDGQGFPAWTTAFAGADTLCAVSDITATLDGDLAYVSWSAPTATVNGGYTDFDAITYTVYLVKGTERTLLAENLDATEISASLPGNGTYRFEITPWSCGVEGIAALSEELTLQSLESLPYACGFEDSDGGTLWTAVNTGSYGWSVQKGYAYQQLDGKFAQFKTGGSAAIPADDWFISPAVECPAGDYRLEFYANGGSFDTHTYKIWVGPDTLEPSLFEQEIYSIDDEKIYGETDALNHYVPVSIDFTLSEAGPHRIGFQGIGAAIYATLKIDNFSLQCLTQSGVKADAAPDVLLISGHKVTVPGAEAITVYTPDGCLAARSEGQSITLSRGTYLLCIHTETGIRTRKVMIAR